MMILIKDKNNDTYVFCNVEFVLHENENGNGYCTIRDMIEHKLLYKCFTDNIKQLTVDGIKLIETIDIDDTLGELLRDE